MRPEQIHELLPGQYLIEVVIPEERSISGESLSRGLTTMGWEKVVPDQSEKDSECRRVVGEIGRLCSLIDTPSMTWSVARIGIDVFGDLEYKLKPLDVEKDRVHELLFIARMKAHPTREAVEKALGEMGFDMHLLSALKRDMRVPGYPGASAALWFGVGTWRGPTNYVNADDAFYFEEVREVGEEAHELVSSQPEEKEGKG
jgi:hypothetical protein